VGVFTWIVFGFLAGTIAGIVTRTPGRGCLTKVVVGVLGALIGGALARAAGLKSVSFRSFTLGGFVTAVIGASLLLLVLAALGDRSRRPGRGLRNR
jgi:uncharacterized membrane protein YeaQ/YmgE (transglycosylase-associated protein family)